MNLRIRCSSDLDFKYFVLCSCCVDPSLLPKLKSDASSGQILLITESGAVAATWTEKGLQRAVANARPPATSASARPISAQRPAAAVRIFTAPSNDLFVDTGCRGDRVTLVASQEARSSGRFQKMLAAWDMNRDISIRRDRFDSCCLATAGIITASSCTDLVKRKRNVLQLIINI
ncbi:Protein of unknown function [Gryllus bimaculatus]|nr:Protein of unknown function [Gryllus bimaculatus]